MGELESQDLYERLGLARDASPAQINAAFRTRARDVHPDRFADDHPSIRAEAERQFKLLNEAYEILRDPVSRADYDRYGLVRPVYEIRVEPEFIRIADAGRVARIRSTIHGIAAGDAADIEVSCSDPQLELVDVSIGAVRDEAADIVIHAAILGGGSRKVVLRYSAAGAVAEQTLQIDVRLKVARDIARPFTSVAVGFWGLFPFGLAGLGFLLIALYWALALSGDPPPAVIGFGVGAAVMGCILIARNVIIARAGLQAAGWTRLGVIVATIAVYRLVLAVISSL